MQAAYDPAVLRRESGTRLAASTKTATEANSAARSTTSGGRRPGGRDINDPHLCVMVSPS